MAKSLDIRREQPSYRWVWITVLSVAGIAVLLIGACTVTMIVAINRSSTAPRDSGDARAYLLEHLRMPVRSIAVSPDGKTVAAGCHDGTIHTWDIVSGAPGPAFQQRHGGIVSGLAYTPDGQTLASASYDKTVMLWDVATGQPTRTLQGHKVAIWSLAVSAAGNRLVSSGPYKGENLPVPGDVRLWDLPVAAEKDLGDLEKKFGGVSAVALSADGDSLFLASTDATVMKWDIAAQQSKALYNGPKDSLWCMTLSQNGKLVAAGAGRSGMWIWDVATEKELHVMPGDAQSMVFLRDDKILAAITRDDRTVRFFDTATGKQLASVKDEDSHPSFLAATPDGKTLVVGRAQYDEMQRPLVGDVKVWDLDRVLPAR